MAVSRRVTLAMGGAALSATLMGALVLAPVGGSASGAVTTPGGCSATAHIDAQWGSGASGGEIVAVTVANTSGRQATQWAVSWSVLGGQSLVSAWNAAVTTSGSTMTAVNMPYNGALTAGASTTFGMQLSGTGSLASVTCANDVPPPTSASPPPTNADVNVGLADNGVNLTLIVGQTLGVSLNQYFDPATVTGPALAQVSSSGGYPNGPFTGIYRAVAPGSVDVTAHTDDPCLHTSPPCEVPILQWIAHVTVVAPSVSGSGQLVTVTTVNNHGAVDLHVGDTLEVNLPYSYVQPALSVGAILTMHDTAGGYPTTQQLVAHYIAVAPGSLDVSSHTDYPCNHDPTPCPAPMMPWTVHVTVTG